MAQFLYFFPYGTGDRATEKGRLNEEILKKHGLDLVFKDNMTSPDMLSIQKSPGPGDSAGVVIVPIGPNGQRPPKTICDLSQQTWFPRDGFAIGVENGQIPTPEELERREVYTGYDLKDAYDNHWAIPVIKMPDSESGSLPAEFSWEPDGSMVKTVSAEFKNVWELAGKALDYLQDATTQESDEREFRVKWPEQTLAEMAVRFLAINYRVSVHELTVLQKLNRGVVNTTFVTNVLSAVTHWPAWLEWLQVRTQQEGESKKNSATLEVA